MEVSAEEEINQIKVGKPHVVILGAGASYAAFPKGDRNGRKLPLMNNFVETLGLEDLISRTGSSFSSTNFEDIHQRGQVLSFANTYLFVKQRKNQPPASKRPSPV